MRAFSSKNDDKIKMKMNDNLNGLEMMNMISSSPSNSFSPPTTHQNQYELIKNKSGNGDDDVLIDENAGNMNVGQIGPVSMDSEIDDVFINNNNANIDGLDGVSSLKR